MRDLSLQISVVSPWNGNNIYLSYSTGQWLTTFPSLEILHLWLPGHPSFLVYSFQPTLWGHSLPPPPTAGSPQDSILPPFLHWLCTLLLENYTPQLQLPSMNYDSQISSPAQTSLLRGESLFTVSLGGSSVPWLNIPTTYLLCFP